MKSERHQYLKQEEVVMRLKMGERIRHFTSNFPACVRGQAMIKFEYGHPREISTQTFKSLERKGLLKNISGDSFDSKTYEYKGTEDGLKTDG
jgi:hypothetical protein